MMMKTLEVLQLVAECQVECQVWEEWVEWAA
jgi:hypothetical protein